MYLPSMTFDQVKIVFLTRNRHFCHFHSLYCGHWPCLFLDEFFSNKYQDVTLKGNLKEQPYFTLSKYIYIIDIGDKNFQSITFHLFSLTYKYEISNAFFSKPCFQNWFARFLKILWTDFDDTNGNRRRINAAIVRRELFFNFFTLDYKKKVKNPFFHFQMAAICRGRYATAGRTVVRDTPLYFRNLRL